MLKSCAQFSIGHVERVPAGVEVGDDRLERPVAVAVDDVAPVAVGQQLRVVAGRRPATRPTHGPTPTSARSSSTGATLSTRQASVTSSSTTAQDSGGSRRLTVPSSARHAVERDEPDAVLRVLGVGGVPVAALGHGQHLGARDRPGGPAAQVDRRRRRPRRDRGSPGTARRARAPRPRWPRRRPGPRRRNRCGLVPVGRRRAVRRITPRRQRGHPRERPEDRLPPRRAALLRADRRDDVDQLRLVGDLHAVAVPQQRVEQRADDDGVGDEYSSSMIRGCSCHTPAFSITCGWSSVSLPRLVPDVPLVEREVDLLLVLAAAPAPRRPWRPPTR